MTDKKAGNLEHSVRERLLNLARSEGVEFQLVLTKYANERFLYRLGTSPYKKKFVLKGATLLSVWFEVPGRQTRDVDLLGRGPAEPEKTIEMFKAVAGIQAHDGLRFDAATIRYEEIRESGDYEGTRVKLDAFLGTARVPLQFDVAFGDALVVRPAVTGYPYLARPAFSSIACLSR